MNINSKLRWAVRLAMGAGALATLSPPAVMAQVEDETIEEIITTGSRIKRADLDSASPVTIINREAITALGITDVGNLIQRMPSMSGSPIGTTTNNGGTGAVEIDLRGMGVDRTLTLVNGLRTVDAGDYQTIPANMIERVEILKDGASAVYGADAVAGVVNIITRKDFTGIELTAQATDFFDMQSGQQTTFSLIAGRQFDSGNVLFGAEYVDQEHAYQSDTPWDHMQNAYYLYPEGCENQVTAPYDGLPTGGCLRLGSSRIPESRLQFISNGNNVANGQGLFLVGTPASAPYQVGLLLPHDGRTYNYAPVNYIQTPYERTNLFLEAHYDVMPNVRFNTMVRGNWRESSQELAPLPFTPPDPMFNGVFNGLAYNGISPDNYYLRRAVDAYNATNPATPLAYEPVSDARRRMIESSRRFNQTVNQYQVSAGLEGTFNEIDWEIVYNTGRRSRTDADIGNFSGPRLSNAFGPSADLDGDGQPECYTDINNPATRINGCVPMNFFGGGVVDPVTSQPTVTTITQDMLDYAAVTLIDTYITTMDTVGFTVAGSMFDLPAGEIGWAAGYGYWGQTYTYNPDSAKVTSSATGSVGAGTAGSLYNNSVFAELLLPVFDNGTQSIDVKAGVRYDDWNAFDGDATWQLGLEFRATESLKLRATGGTVFRAPTITNLYSGLVDSSPQYSDPCVPGVGQPLPPGCAQVGVQVDTQVQAKEGGNPDLIPETGSTFTAGFVWQPEFGESDLSLTVDYWQVAIEDGISTLGVQYTMDQCYLYLDQEACAKITRGPLYDITLIYDGDINVAEQGAKGIDTEIRWSLDSSVGQWQASLLWSHLLERTKIAQPGVPEEDLAGRFTDPTAEDGGGYAADKFNYAVQWFNRGMAVGYFGEFIGGVDADTSCNCGAGNQPDGSYVQKIDSMLYHDIVASYEFESTGTNIAIGATNLTNEEPPWIDIGFNADTDPSTYRMLGRGYYVRLTQTFE